LITFILTSIQKVPRIHEVSARVEYYLERGSLTTSGNWRKGPDYRSTGLIDVPGMPVYPRPMKRFRSYLVILVIVAIVVGGVTYAVLRMRTPSAKVTVPGGKTVEVTPTKDMRVETAEGTPNIDISTYRLKVSGLVNQPLSLSFDEVKAMKSEERLVKLPCVEGWTEKAMWKGPRLSDVLGKAGVQKGAETVIFSSPGDYTTSLTVEDIKKTDPLLAYEVNGDKLPVDQGYPVRLVVPNKLGYKWIKWVVGIKVAKGEYKGFWESRGYSNEADATGR
jgi:DMSO/TMAO reductase YedYZ molybdopterin-dependent catalytic subunit